ncbi:MAG TPA: acetylxylan esterase [Fimbriimonas sp.]|nr:acetylxylan esterase [Fimbriimonas sp.]
MPLVDLPLEQLETYQGLNPKPADFDAFWDRSLAEMNALDPQIELAPHPFPASFAECFELRFTGLGGARVFAKYIRPKGAKNCPAVLMFHGYSMHSGDWYDKLNYVANGFCVAAMDCRGQGGLSEDVGGMRGTTLRGHIIRGLDDSPEKLLFRHIFLDTAELAKIVMGFDEVDAERVGCTGGSQGGGLTLACAALEPRIKRAAPWYPFLSDYLRVWEMDLDVAAYDELRNFFRSHDPRHERRAEIFNRLGYIDVQHLAPRIKAEVLMGMGLMDTITPPSSCFAAFNKIPSKKRVVIYPDFGHEGLPGFGDMVYSFLSEL